MQPDSKLIAEAKSRWRWFWGGLLCGLACFGVWLGFAIRTAREAARASQCIGYPKQLALALHNYHVVYGCFPPAVVTDANGTPMHSWRALILPFMDREELATQYRYNEPWNSPHNQNLAESSAPFFFRCPSQPSSATSCYTNYVLVTGEGTVFPPGRTTKLEDIEDPLEETLLLVEITGTDIQWSEPRDMDVETMSLRINDPQRPSISSKHPWGPVTAFADGSVRRLTESMKPETIRAFTTMNGGEPPQRVQ